MRQFTVFIASFFVLVFSTATCSAAFKVLPVPEIQQTDFSSSMQSNTIGLPIVASGINMQNAAPVGQLRTLGLPGSSADHKIRSGIFGRLAFYCGLVSLIGFIVAMCTLFTPFHINALTVWVYFALFALVFGTIGLVHRKKKGMAVAGLALGCLQVVLLVAVGAFISAVVSAAPAIMAAMFILGHG